MCFSQGSDIETLGSEAVVEEEVERLENPTVEESTLQETPLSAGKNLHTFFSLAELVLL